MKRTEAERLYEKYTKLGAKVEFTFDTHGRVEAVNIRSSDKSSGWTISISNLALTIIGAPLPVAEITIDYLLTGKVE